MNSNPNILNELKELSPVVAAINRQLPYQVPAGYFDSLPATINGRIASDAGVLDGAKDNMYTIPQGYFNSLADSIMNRIKAAEAGTPQEELSHLSTVLNKIERTIPYTKPPGYFEELPGNIIAGAKAVDFVNEELENLTPLMSSLKTKQVYEVPSHYFDTFANNVLGKVQAQNAKVVSISFRKRVLKYAAAAVITGIVAMSAWMYNGNVTPPIASADNIPLEIKALNDSTLMSFTDNNILPLIETTDISINDLVANDDNDLLTDLPDETLQQYLEEDGADNSTLIN
jgi:hypothetical protein